METSENIWCWFDLVILDNAEALAPRVQDGRALVWRSHDIPREAAGEDEQTGKLFGRDHEMLGLLKVLFAPTQFRLISQLNPRSETSLLCVLVPDSQVGNSMRTMLDL